MASITVVTPDMEVHLTGCGHIAKMLKRYDFNAKSAIDYAGDTPAGAILAADTDMAAWFCEEPYTDSSRDNGCWTIATCTPAPCVRPVLRSVSYNGTAAPADK